MEKYKSKSEYENALLERSELPKGFRVGVIPLEFYPEEKKLDKPLPMNLSLILMDKKTDSFAGVFTKNKFPGHPVTHGRELLKSPYVQGVLINNKISNVRCKGGLEDIDTLLSALSKSVGVDKNLMFSSSTGIIGWKLPVKDMVNVMPELNNSLNKDSVLPVSKAIMTTDNFPKVRSINLGDGKIVAIAKGAGMIEPNMATMLLFILTDIKIPRDSLRNIHSRVINKTFNRISIDSDQSTSDTGLIFSSNIYSGVDLKEFEDALYSVCLDLSQDLVRNGEGTAHVIEVKVKGAETEDIALKIGKGVINAPLLKAAIYGNDPNLGRIIQAVGDVCGNYDINIDPDLLEVSMGEEVLYQNGEFTLSQDLERKLSLYLKERALSEKANGFPEHRNNVEIVIDLKNGANEVTVFGSDLSYEYVRENADYRS